MSRIRKLRSPRRRNKVLALTHLACVVIASGAKQSIWPLAETWIASSLCSSQRRCVSIYLDHALRPHRRRFQLHAARPRHQIELELDELRRAKIPGLGAHAGDAAS